MSGICGICRPGKIVSDNDIRHMAVELAVANREQQAVISRESVALGVSRLFPGQELACVDGVEVAAHADLLNLEELRSEIKAQGLPKPDSAAAVIASLYALRGLDCVEELEGAFSFALWDQERRRLVLAIDRLGIKNLYWRLAKGNLSFGTRLDALRAFDRGLELDERAIAQFMIFSAVPAPLAIYRGVEKIRPGFALVFENGQVSHKQYWDLQFSNEFRSESQWAELVRNELRASVHRHLANADLERTGAFLSGGTDSSTVVAFMNELRRPVRTFSIVFREAAYSEASFVQTIVERFQTEHHEDSLTPKDALKAISKIAEYYDEPLANSSAVAAYFCGVMARESGMGTLLGGDGGDELFAGNQRYETDKRFALYHNLPLPLRRGVIEPLTRLLPREHRWLGLPARYVRRASIPNPQRFFSRNFFFSVPPEDIFEQEFLRQAPGESWLNVPEAHFAQQNSTDELNRLLYLDVKMALADNDLKKVSGMAELSGIRVRYPLLDHRLVELAGRVPAGLKLRRFEKRYIFKQAMRDVLPPKVLYKKKHGMGVPVSAWLLNNPELRNFALDVLHDRRTRERGYFRAGFVERLLELQSSEHVSYYGEILWYLLTLELWHRVHLERFSKEACAD